MVLYEMATGTLPLTGKTAVMVFAGGVHQPPDNAPLRVDLPLVVLNRRHTASLPFAPGMTGAVPYRFC